MNYFWSGPVNTNWGPGLVYTNWASGPANTNWRQGLGSWARAEGQAKGQGPGNTKTRNSMHF